MKIAVTKRVSPRKAAALANVAPVETQCSTNAASGGNLIQHSGVLRQAGNISQYNPYMVSASELAEESVERHHSNENVDSGHDIETDDGANLGGEQYDDSEEAIVSYAEAQVMDRGSKMLSNPADVKVKVLGGSAFGGNAGGARNMPLRSNLQVVADPEAEVSTEGERIKVELTEFDDALDEALADESAALERFECAECGIKFARHNALRQHARKVHATRLGVQCEVCGKSFRYLGSMPRHMMLHASIKPFVCSVCGTQFAQKGDLRRHERLHTGERPFSCPECSATFNREYSLKKHLHTHTGERPFACQVCERRFSSRSSVTRHLQTHAHAAVATAAAYQHEEEYEPPDGVEMGDGEAAEVELGVGNENLEEEGQLDDYVALDAAAASSVGASKRRYKQSARSRAAASNHEVDPETLDATWILSNHR